LSKYNYTIDMTIDNAHTFILKNIVPDSRVLEFGPAMGYMTKYMKEQLGCSVTCVEIDPVAAEISAKYTEEMIVADLNSNVWVHLLAGRKFDYIIFADVLEHLISPSTVLAMAIECLDFNGSVMTSIPNVSHSAVLMGLFEGEFEYRKLGLLDNTHLRFFTRKSVQDLLSGAGLQPIQWWESVLEPEKTEMRKSYTKFPLSLQAFLKKRKDAHVYQFVTISKMINANIQPLDTESVIIPAFKEFLHMFAVDGAGEDKLVLQTEIVRQSDDYFSDIPIDATALRMEPGNKVGEFRFVNIELTDVSVDGEVISTLSWNEGNLFSGLKGRIGVVEISRGESCSFISLTNNPQIILELTEARRNVTHRKMRVRLEYIEDIPLETVDSLSSLRGKLIEINDCNFNLKDELKLVIVENLDQKEKINILEQKMELMLADLDEIKISAVETSKTLHLRETEVAYLDTRIKGLLSSRSWKATAPLRNVVGINNSIAMKVKSALLIVMSSLFEFVSKSSLVQRFNLKLFKLVKKSNSPFRPLAKRMYYKMIRLRYSVENRKRERLFLQSSSPTEQLVSILIPVYNNSVFLERSIRSAVGQSHKNIEIVIVNDSSTETEVAEILEKFRTHQNLIIYNNPHNKGISDTQNKCLEIASGSIMAFLDCDDILLPNSVENSLAYWTNETRYSFSNRIHIDNEDIEIARVDFHELPMNDLFKEQLDIRMFASHFKMIHREVFENIGIFNSRFDGAQDYDFVLRAAFYLPRSAFTYVPEFLYKHRIHPNQSSSVQNEGQMSLARVINDEAKMRQNIKNGIFDKFISFLILSYGKENQILTCVERIKKTVKIPHEIIILDNNSGLNCKTFLRDNVEPISGVRVVYWDVNIGCAGGRKELSKLAEKDSYLIFLDNDIEVMDGWLEEILVRGEESKVIKSVCCRVAFPDGVLQFTGGEFEVKGNRIRFSLFDSGKSINDLSALYRRNNDWNPGGATLFKEGFPAVDGYPNTYEDAAVSFKLKDNQGMMVNAPNSLVVHRHIMFDRGLQEKETQYLSDRYNKEMMLKSLAQFYLDFGLIIEDFYVFGANNIDVAKLSDEDVIIIFKGLYI